MAPTTTINPPTVSNTVFFIQLSRRQCETDEVARVMNEDPSIPHHAHRGVGELVGSPWPSHTGSSPWSAPAGLTPSPPLAESSGRHRQAVCPCKHAGMAESRIDVVP